MSDDNQNPLRPKVDSTTPVPPLPDGITDEQATVLSAGQPTAVHKDPAVEFHGLEFLQPSLKPGSLGLLGHYEVLEVLGHGGFGVVLRAFDEKLQRVVAIKVLSANLASTSPARKRFVREARAGARVRHENIVQIYAVEELPVPYLVMEFIPGQTLQQRIDEKGPLEVQEILVIGQQIASGLAAAHEQGLIHRDVKPCNILLESGTELKVKITDFGLARTADDASISQSGLISGTPMYMAPEQAKGETLDHRVDLFSLGSVLYAMTTGRPPFRAANTLAVMKRVTEEDPRPIPEIIPETPNWLCKIIGKLHAKDRTQRWQTAAEVADVLRRHLAHYLHPTVAPRPESVVVPRTVSPRSPGILAAIAVGCVGLGIALTFPFWHSAPQVPVNKDGATAERRAMLVQKPVEAKPVTHVIQGRPGVRDALIDFVDPERRFGSVDRDNALRLAEQGNAFLVHFDLSKLPLSPPARVARATLSFYVWDPSSSGKSKVCVFPLKTDWDESEVTWRQAAAGRPWQSGDGFALWKDTGPSGSNVVVQPETDTDTLEPPGEYQLDVTELVRSWIDGSMVNCGLALAPVIDPSVDEGVRSRFQILATESNRTQFTPKLEIQVHP